MTDRLLPAASPFAGDDGRADLSLEAALATFTAGLGDLDALQHALVGARVLSPIVPLLAELETSDAEFPQEKLTELSTVTVQGRDGRRAIPLFGSMASLAAWDHEARPFPLTAIDAARGALIEGISALLIDFGSVPGAVVEGPRLVALAEGRLWVRPAEDADLLAVIDRALSALPGVIRVSVLAAVEADLAVTLHVSSELSQQDSRLLAQQAAQQLAGLDVLRTRLSRGLDLAVAGSET